MKEIIIACETLRDEIELAIKRTNCSHDIIWFESGLHNVPKKLHLRLQAELDSISDYDRVLLAMGYCGNSVIGLKTGNFSLILPRVDDCISLLLGSNKARANLSQGHGTYFMTKGWLAGERNIWVEYEYAAKKYGEEEAKYIMEMMLGNYKCLGILDDESYSIPSILPQTTMIANELGLSLEIIPATISYIEDLFSGRWSEERFLILPPHTEIKL